MQHTIRWGVMGTGWIAEKFCGALRSLEGYGAQLYAVGSRKKETADAFAARHGFARAYASYEELAADPNVDVVYIATPHRFHLENALLCIRSGRAILCEKAFTVNGDEAEKIAEEAKARGVFAMEAFWPRFQPLNRLLRKLVCEQKIIGDVRMLQVDFDKLEDWPDEHRIYNPELAGGTTLDLGIYTMSYAAYFLGADVRDIHAVATIGKGGVDDQCAIIAAHQSGALSVQPAALQTDGRREALFLGTRGRIRVPDFFKPPYLEIVDDKSGETRRVEREPFLYNGYEYEAIEVMDCIRAGESQSRIMPLDESVALMRLLDRCRADFGFRYPFE